MPARTCLKSHSWLVTRDPDAFLNGDGYLTLKQVDENPSSDIDLQRTKGQRIEPCVLAVQNLSRPFEAA